MYGILNLLRLFVLCSVVFHKQNQSQRRSLSLSSGLRSRTCRSKLRRKMDINRYSFIFIDTARIVCGSVYVTVRCPSVRLSAYLSHLSTAACRRCRGFAGRGYRSIATADGTTAVRRSAANASSVTLSANVGSWTRTMTKTARIKRHFCTYTRIPM